MYNQISHTNYNLIQYQNVKPSEIKNKLKNVSPIELSWRVNEEKKINVIIDKILL